MPSSPVQPSGNGRVQAHQFRDMRANKSPAACSFPRRRSLPMSSRCARCRQCCRSPAGASRRVFVANAVHAANVVRTVTQQRQIVAQAATAPRISPATSAGAQRFPRHRPSPTAATRTSGRHQLREMSRVQRVKGWPPPVPSRTPATAAMKSSASAPSCFKVGQPKAASHSRIAGSCPRKSSASAAAAPCTPGELHPPGRLAPVKDHAP
jgi:hypothetical protein